MANPSWVRRLIAKHFTRTTALPPVTVAEPDRLPLPDRVDVKLLAPDFLLCKNVIPWSADLINLVNKIDNWSQSTQVKSNSSESYKDNLRTSSSYVVSCKDPKWGAQLAPFELGIMTALHSCAKAYLAYNPYCIITDDTGYELLRYEEGQEFGEHVDTISGRHEGNRQLTALIYLNDDYQGGETNFSRQGLTVQASAGDVLLFPSNFVYPHSSPPVVGGVKYVIVTWFVAYPGNK